MRFTRHGGLAALTTAILAALSACTETPQSSAKSSRAVDHPPWETAQTRYGAASVPQGDKSAWEAQMRTRVENQNEYSRTP